MYRKIHLVPFGEYIPFKNLLYFVSPLVERLADFAPGTSMVMLPVGAHQVNTAICYEVVYPSLIRQAVQGGTQLLTTITNDGWYGRSSAPFQHFEMATMRAIEQGRYLARAANTGISGVVDPYGRIVQQSAIFEESGIVQEVRLLTRFWHATKNTMKGVRAEARGRNDAVPAYPDGIEEVAALLSRLTESAR